MSDLTLQDCRVLVVEDEFFLADELAMELADAGAWVIGPAGTVAEAIAIIEAEPHIHGAVLDVNLRGEKVFPAADRLLERGVPIVFTSGYDTTAFPSRFAHAVRCEKPTDMRRVTQAIGRAIKS